jgi:hypothetical protein
MLARPSVLILLGLVVYSEACIQMYGTVQEGLVSSSGLDQHVPHRASILLTTSRQQVQMLTI